MQAKIFVFVIMLSLTLVLVLFFIITKNRLPYLSNFPYVYGFLVPYAVLAMLSGVIVGSVIGFLIWLRKR